MPIFHHPPWMRRQQRGGAATYIDTVLSVATANLIAYWPQTETSGTVADNAEGTAARDGTYSGVTLAQIADPFGGFLSPLYDGVNDVLNVDSASLEAAWNHSLWSLLLWHKVANVGVWTDGSTDKAMVFQVDVNNYFKINKTSTSNQITVETRSGGTTDNISKSGLSNTTWSMSVITVDRANDRIRWYLDNVLVGTATTLGTWAGTNFNPAVIGANTAGGGEPWNGYLSHAAVWAGVELTTTEVNTLWNGGPLS